MSKIQRVHHQLDSSDLPSQYTTLIRAPFPPSLSDIQDMSMRRTDRQNWDFSHARMAGTNMRINNTAFSIRGRTILNSIFTLTSVPDHQCCPYKNNILVGVCQKTSIESYIGRSTNYREINQPGKSRTKYKFDVHVMELRNRTERVKPKAKPRTKRIEKIMDNCLLRFHTAQVRSVRITSRR